MTRSLTSLTGSLFALCGLIASCAPGTVESHRRGSEASQHAPSIDPWLVHVDQESFTIAYVTQKSTYGRVTVQSEFGKAAVRESKSRTHHRITVDSLRPNTTYRYEVDGIHSGTVRTDATVKNIKFAAFGHPGGTMSAGAFPVGALAGALDDINPDLILCTGDLCNYTLPSSFQELYFTPFGELAKRLPIYVSAGNHELGFPRRKDQGYKVFRSLFPYDYDGAEGPFYTFTRGNVQFFAVTYLPLHRRDLVDQLRWLKKELAASTAEFRVAFLGGNNRDRQGFFDALVEAMAAGGVDAIFGGDGTRSSHDLLSGIDYFFAGTNRLTAPDFYLTEARPYELIVRKLNVAFDSKPEIWSIPSQRTKETVKDLLPLLRVREKNEAELVAFDIDLPEEAADGVRMTLNNPTDSHVYVRFCWAPKALGDAPPGNKMYRAHIPHIEPLTTRTVDFPLPDADPLTGSPFALGSIEVRVSVGAKSDQEGVQQWIERLEVFRDPLRSQQTQRTSGK